jgi:hypothetical protein
VSYRKSVSQTVPTAVVASAIGMPALAYSTPISQTARVTFQKRQQEGAKTGRSEKDFVWFRKNKISL